MRKIINGKMYDTSTAKRRSGTIDVGNVKS